MVLRLSQDVAEDRVIEIRPGITFTCRPLTSFLNDTAEAWAFRRLADAVEQPAVLNEALEAMGWTGAPPDFEDPDVRLGALKTLKRQKLAEEAITGWDGVVDDKTGKSVACTPETVRLVMALCPEEAAIWFNAYTRFLERLRDAKNGSAPSSAGASAVGGVTAKPARKRGRPARKAEGAPTVSSARNSSTGRGRRKKPES